MQIRGRIAKDRSQSSVPKAPSVRPILARLVDLIGLLRHFRNKDKDRAPIRQGKRKLALYTVITA